MASAGAAHTCALLFSGNVLCWGDDSWGQAGGYAGGNATAIDAAEFHSCALLSTGNVECWGAYSGTAYSGGDAVRMTTGEFHLCVLRASGFVDCWGNNFYGQAADYSVGDAIAVAAGKDFSCVLLTSGGVSCWGNNDTGQASGYSGGDALGISAGWQHACALLSTGNVTCWGANDFGQAGGYTGGDAVSLTAGQSHTCALLRNGSAACWGSNDAGQSQPHTPVFGPVACDDGLDNDLDGAADFPEDESCTSASQNDEWDTVQVGTDSAEEQKTIPGQTSPGLPPFLDPMPLVPEVAVAAATTGATVGVQVHLVQLEPANPIDIFVPTPFGPIPITICEENCWLPMALELGAETSVSGSVRIDTATVEHTAPISYP